MRELIPSEAARKLERLRGMSPRELSHRVRLKAYSELDRITSGVGIGGRMAAAEPFKDYLAGAPSDRFYRSHAEDMRPFVRENFPEWIERAVAEADKICRHELNLLGYGTVALGAEIDWSRDPVTGQVWEQRFWTAYRPANDSGGRDPKIIHELNRHQHLPRLAKAYRLTGDERYAVEAVAQLNGWIDQNPPGRGINWQSSLEIAIRTISWLWTIFPILPSRAFDDASAQRIGNSLFAQLEHVHRYSSLFSSPNTHLIGESAALFIAGLVFRDLKRPAIWLRDASALLAGAAEKQVLGDGVYGELSSCYHCYALDFFQQAEVLAERNGFQLPEPVARKVRGMLHFLMHLTRPDGTLPSLGDDDGGRALALDRRDYRSFQDGLCLGAIVCGRGDFKYQAGAFCEEALWMLGAHAWETYRQLESREPAGTQAYYPFAGYLIQRSGWGPLASHLVFDCGGLGMLTGAHAHADALSVTLFSRGTELLVDPGTFVYNCAPEWRRHFRSTAAHNTVTIDGRDQAEQEGTFHWRTSIRSSAARDLPFPGIEYAEAEHDGYRGLPQGVTHRRRLLRIPPESWIVVDDFRGSGEHTFDFNYHVPGGEELSGRLCVMASASMATERIEGWISRGYGEKHPCDLLRATVAGAAPVAAMTFLLPGEQCGAAVRQLTLESGSGIACAYEHDGFEDVVVLSTADSELSVAGFHMRGEYFWLRLEGGDLKQVLAVRARSLDRDRDGRNIFRRADPGPWLGLVDTGWEEQRSCAEFAGS